MTVAYELGKGRNVEETMIRGGRKVSEIGKRKQQPEALHYHYQGW